MGHGTCPSDPSSLKECSEPSTAIKLFLYTFPTPNKINVQTHLDLVGYRWLVFQLVFY